MGTHWNAKVSTLRKDNERIERVITKVLDTVIQQMSPWEMDSDLRKFKNANPSEWVTFAPESFTVLTRALEIAEITSGVYDPTLAKTIDLLGFGPSDSPNNNLQSPAVQEALKQCGFQKISLNPKNRKALQTGGLEIDLCSIAKGFAVDLIAESLTADGYNNYFIEIGGEIRGSGCKPNGEPWWCSIARPPEAEHQISETLVAVCDVSIATSGNYLNFRIKDNQVIGHLIPPQTDVHSKQTLLSVSVFSNTCMDADAFASALFLMGTEKALTFANTHNIAALFRIDDNGHFKEIESNPLHQLFEQEA